jgi:hypothetical protein
MYGGPQAWTIAAKFTASRTNDEIPDSYYDKYFKNALWIEGVSEGAPRSVDPDYLEVSPYMRTESINWDSYLVKDKNYQLRLTIFDGMSEVSESPHPHDFTF